MPKRSRNSTSSTFRKKTILSYFAFVLAAGLTLGTGMTSATAITVIPNYNSKISSLLSGQPSSKIVGGNDMAISEAPWQVAIIDRQAANNRAGQFCGGSLISAEWIVTAAHCVDYGSSVARPSDIGIQVGNATLSTSSLSVRAVSTIHIHPNYVSSGNNHDVALIQLSSPVSFSSNVAALSLYRSVVAHNTAALITGWGQTGMTDDYGTVYGSRFPTTLQGTTVTVSNDTCFNAAPVGFNPETMLCAGTQNWMNDTCQGDSGGPLAINVSGNNYLAGITSWGYGCAWYSPGIYTKVSNYVAWIESIVGAAPAEFNASPSPTISGYAVVGQTISAVTGDWDPAPSFTYQWFAGGRAISRATGSTYAVTRSDLNKTLTLSVTATSPGYVSTTRTSSATSSVTATMPFATTGTPSISGSPVIGQTLTANTGSWSPTPRFSYQWLANNAAIRKATGATYVLSSADAGKTISVRITASLSGFTTTTVTSASTEYVTAGLSFTLSPTPTISGTPAVGQPLTANLGSWDPEPTFSYQWFSSGRAISRATSSTFVVTSSYRGKAITVQVTGNLDGYAPTTRTSGSVAIPRR